MSERITHSGHFFPMLEAFCNKKRSFQFECWLLPSMCMILSISRYSLFTCDQVITFPALFYAELKRMFRIEISRAISSVVKACVLDSGKRQMSAPSRRIRVVAHDLISCGAAQGRVAFFPYIALEQTQRASADWQRIAGKSLRASLFHDLSMRCQMIADLTLQKV